MNQDHRIVVIGVGGAGCKVITQAARQAIPGVGWVAVDTDTVSLQLSEVPQKVLIGRNMTRGLGSGGMADRGRQAAEEAYAELSQVLQGAETVIITSGLGGGTGAGAAPVVGRIAQELGAWTVAVVSKPFSFEGDRRKRMAEAGFADLAAHTDVQIVMPIDSILILLDKKATLAQAFSTSDRILLEVIHSVIRLVMAPHAAKPGLEEICAALPHRERDIVVVTAG
jgi:cell division protein FtsZ